MRRVRGSMSDPAYRRLLVVLGAGSIVAGVLLFCSVFLPDIARGLAARGWDAVPCTIRASSVVIDWDSEGGRHYDPQVEYEYEMDGDRYTSRSVYFGKTVPGRRKWAEDLAARFPAGSEAVCYVDPSDPHRAVLDRSFPVPTLIWSALPAAFVAFGIGVGVWLWKTRHWKSTPYRRWEHRP